MRLIKTNTISLVKKRKNYFVNIFLFCTIVLSGLNNDVFAQNEPVITLDHDAKYLKKVENSAAKNLILATDTLIAKAVEAKTTFSSYKEIVKNRRNFVSNSYLIKQNKQKISELDPKWKMDKIDGHLDIYDKHYGYCKDLDDEITANEINEYFSIITNKIRTLKGQDLLTYVSGANESSMLIDEFNKQKTFAEQFAKSANRPYMPGYYNFETYLSTILKSFRDKYYNSHFNQPVKNNANLLAMQEEYVRAIPETKAFLLLHPDNTELKTMLSQMESNSEIIEEKLSNFFVSDFHKNNVGKIFFSDHKITFGNETEKDFKTDFNGGEAIYVIHYLDAEIDAQKIINYRFGRPGAVEQDKIVNFKILPFIEKEGQKNVSVLQYALVPKIGTASNDELISVIAPLRYLSKQIEYLNQQTVEDLSNYWVTNSSYGQEDNKASFIVKINATENYTKIYEDIRDIKANTIPMPKAGMTDASAEASVKKGIDYLAENNSLYANIKVVKVIIVSKAWTFETFFNSSQIKSRSLNNVYAVCKDEKGKCFLLTGNLYQKKEGNTYNSGSFSTSSAFDFSDGNGDFIQQDGNYRLYINCDKVK